MTTTEDGDEERLLCGRYRVGSLIGRGGMGTVWNAVDEILHRDVAVKEVLAPPSVSEEERKSLYERTLREARAAARISHPNVVTVYDVVEQDGRPWIVMEVVHARSLSQVIDQDGALPPRRVAEIGAKVLGALRAAHAQGILHRDVKPGNVLVADNGQVVLTDFGIAQVEGDVSLTATGILVGAPGYIAPERARGLPFGPSSDLWALAATLYAAAEGRPAFDRSGILPTLTAVLTEDPPPMELAGVLRPLLEAMLRKDPEERPSAAEAERRFREIETTGTDSGADATTAIPGKSDTKQVPATILPATPPPTRRWWQSRKGKAIAATSMAGVTAAAVLAALLILRPQTPAPTGDNKPQEPTSSPASFSLELPTATRPTSRPRNTGNQQPNPPSNVDNPPASHHTPSSTTTTAPKTTSSTTTTTPPKTTSSSPPAQTSSSVVPPTTNPSTKPAGEGG